MLSINASGQAEFFSKIDFRDPITPSLRVAIVVRTEKALPERKLFLSESSFCPFFSVRLVCLKANFGY